jgi:hypothetical protein
MQRPAAGLLVLGLVLFVWGRWRHDVIALSVLVRCALKTPYRDGTTHVIFEPEDPLRATRFGPRSAACE